MIIRIKIIIVILIVINSYIIIKGNGNDKIDENMLKIKIIKKIENNRVYVIILNNHNYHNNKQNIYNKQNT